MAYDLPDRAAQPPDQGRLPGYPPHPPPPSTNGMAVASMVLGIVGVILGWLLMGVPSVLAVIFGHVALAAIRRTGQHGRGMAIAGLVTGYIVVGIVALLILVAIAGA